MENLNEEKQIEEIAKVIKSSLDGLGCGKFNFTAEEISTMFAKALYNAGYRKQEWISVEDRLPENIVNCIVHYVHSYSCEDGYYAIGMFLYDGNKFIIGKEYKVTHWMPLPEAPKMKGGAEDDK